jgi:hypothetical protein
MPKRDMLHPGIGVRGFFGLKISAVTPADTSSRSSNSNFVKRSLPLRLLFQAAIVPGFLGSPNLHAPRQHRGHWLDSINLEGNRTDCVSSLYIIDGGKGPTDIG